MGHLPTSIRSLVLAAALAVASATAALAWGAIAVDDEVGQQADDVGYGFSTGHDTEGEARRGAMAECRKSGNNSCKVVLTFKACGAYAASRRYYGVGEGSTKERAEQTAVQLCGRAACAVVISECDD